MKKKNIFKKLDDVIYGFLKTNDELRRDELFKEWQLLMEIKRRGWSIDRAISEVQKELKSELNITV